MLNSENIKLKINYLPKVRLGRCAYERSSACLISRLPTKSYKVTGVSLHLQSLGSGQSGHVVGGPHKSSYDSRFGGNDPKIAMAFESPTLVCGLVLSASK